MIRCWRSKVKISPSVWTWSYGGTLRHAVKLQLDFEWVESTVKSRNPTIKTWEKPASAAVMGETGPTPAADWFFTSLKGCEYFINHSAGWLLSDLVCFVPVCFQVIVALLNKFTVADNPAKYALYKRCRREEQGKFLTDLHISCFGSDVCGRISGRLALIPRNTHTYTTAAHTLSNTTWGKQLISVLNSHFYID